MAVKNPPGQLAPVPYRATYLARKWAQAAQVAGALCIAATLWEVSGSVSAALQAHSARSAMQVDMDRTAAKVASTDSAISVLGVTPELVRKAVELDDKEISSAPSMQDDLVRLSHVIGGVQGVQLKSLQWQVLGASENACADAGAVPAIVAPGVPPVDGVAPERKVELRFTMLAPEGAGPRLLAQQAAEISRQLALNNVRLLKDPVRTLRRGAITADGTQAQTGGDIEWCAALAGKR